MKGQVLTDEGIECVVCGGFIAYEGREIEDRHLAAHQCPPRVISALESANTRAEEPVQLADDARRPEAERLLAGLRIMYRERLP